MKILGYAGAEGVFTTNETNKKLEKVCMACSGHMKRFKKEGFEFYICRSCNIFYLLQFDWDMIYQIFPTYKKDKMSDDQKKFILILNGNMENVINQIRGEWDWWMNEFKEQLGDMVK